AWEGASLNDVARLTLEPYEPPGGATRVALGGAKVRLGPNAAVTLAMAFHELATNAAKYGALSAPAGRVDVAWTASCGAAEVLEIVWTESGGPPASAPERRGFGARFLERALGREFDGEVELCFAPAGLVCRIRLPLSAKVGVGA
ncbi:MAG: ATP-binding protein, partial [Caulobacteraceae bacterium]